MAVTLAGLVTCAAVLMTQGPVTRGQAVEGSGDGPEALQTNQTTGEITLSKY